MVELPNICVFIAAYNAEPFIRRCLDSITSQHYPHFSVTMVDDASTDKTGELMDDAVGNCPGSCTIIHNAQNKKMPWNLAYLRYGEPEDVIVLVDGDDFLPHPYVLDVIADKYAMHAKGLWLTYGSYERWPDPTWMPNPAKEFPPEVIAERSFRQYSATNLVYNHPLTFRRRLLQNIGDWELQDTEGKWFTAAYDHTIMMPMLEMSAPDHFAWLHEVLYVYNEENTQSEAKIDRTPGISVHTIVNKRIKREQL